jgi:riboflavin synthase
MYTGIIHTYCKVIKARYQQDLITMTVSFPDNLLRGVCLTVTVIDGNNVGFDAALVTMNTTTLGVIKEGDCVNIERSAGMDAEIGGHILSGHIYGMATIVSIDDTDNDRIMTLQVPADWMKYILPKGFIAINGASITVVDTKKSGEFTVCLIPETLRLTTFRQKKVGEHVNVEIDSRTQAIVDTVEEYLNQSSSQREALCD